MQGDFSTKTFDLFSEKEIDRGIGKVFYLKWAISK
jgi:hypothetical protein